jgi:hypothetical protein
VQDRRASTAYPEAKRLLGALANSRGHRHEENAAKLVRVALEEPIGVGVALLASAEGYTPRATKLIEEARESLGTVQEVALALSENLPAPKAQPSRNRRRRKRKKPGTAAPRHCRAERRVPQRNARRRRRRDERVPRPKRRRRRRTARARRVRLASGASAIEAPAKVRGRNKPTPTSIDTG